MGRRAISVSELAELKRRVVEAVTTTPSRKGKNMTEKYVPLSEILSLPRNVTRTLSGDGVEETVDLAAIQAIESREFSTAHWIDDPDSDGSLANCSHCGMQIDVHYNRGYFNYCPNCGFGMFG